MSLRPLKARRSSRSARLVVWFSVASLTKIYSTAGALNPSPSLSISRLARLWTSSTVDTTIIRRVMCQYAYVSIQDASQKARGG